MAQWQSTALESSSEEQEVWLGGKLLTSKARSPGIPHQNPRTKPNHSDLEWHNR